MCCQQQLSPEKMAEREGFEPPIPVKVYTLSRRAPSATRPSLRTAGLFTSILSGKLPLPIPVPSRWNGPDSPRHAVFTMVNTLPVGSARVYGTSLSDGFQLSSAVRFSAGRDLEKGTARRGFQQPSVRRLAREAHSRSSWAAALVTFFMHEFENSWVKRLARIAPGHIPREPSFPRALQYRFLRSIGPASTCSGLT